MARSTLVRLLLLLIASSSCCFFTLPALASAQITHPSEVAALRAVRQQLKDSYGNLNNWTRSTDPCVSNWTGIICAPVDPTDGYLHVQELRLLNLNLSGNLAAELGQLKHVIILNFMWNDISGSIPKEIGYMTSLQLLLLSGNQISGPLPDELGFLPNLIKFQLDLNRISGPLPTSFANLTKAKHFHMNNNSISGQIPPELHTLPALIHMLLDNNNLSGSLPPELSSMPNLRILQLDNNDFNGTGIPDTYGNMTKLVKLSLRNCNLQGGVPDLSAIPNLLYLDLSWNQLTGNIPTNKLSIGITTIDLSYNKLIGSIPSKFSALPNLQILSLENNTLTGSVPNFVWSNMTFSTNATLTLDFQNNLLSNVSATLDPPSNVTIKLFGNPLCKRANELNIVQFCGNQSAGTEPSGSASNWSWKDNCPPQSCPTSDYYEYVPATPDPCFCAAPLGVGLRLRSPSISDFRPYIPEFEVYMTSNLGLTLYQLVIDSFIWTVGPRLKIYLKIFPQYSNTTHILNMSEIQRLTDIIATFAIPSNDTFGPYDLLNFTLNGPYSGVVLNASKSGMSRGSLIGIVLGAISCAIAISLAAVGFFFYKKAAKYRQHEISKRQSIPVKIEGVREFGFEELDRATNSFCIGNQVGQGGYGKVYKGILADGTVVAIKRAQQGSLQGQKEFFTEIELLSRLHHRNLVSLVGYCNEEGEQMLVYEFMPNGSLHNLLAARFKRRVNFSTRLSIALDSARGILYLHTEADPPIIHRDIKANNILLDLNFRAKVSDFGISRLAPVQDSGGVASHVSTVVKGTPGYFDPEYFLTHKLTEKSDVYSLGVVFLELLTGMQPISHGKHIVREVESACESGMMLSIIDQSMGAYPSEGIRRLMQLALRCCDDGTEGRPSMLEIVRELENISCTSTSTSTSTSTPIPTVVHLSGSEAAIPLSSESEMAAAAAAASSSSGMSSSSLSSSLSILQGQGWAQGAAAVRGTRERESCPSSDLVSGVIPIIRPR